MIHQKRWKVLEEISCDTNYTIIANYVNYYFGINYATHCRGNECVANN